MEPNKIINADFLDLLFEGKNKAYGAYELRKSYNKRMSLAVLGLFGLCLLFSLSQIFAGKGGKYGKIIYADSVNLANLKEPEVEKPIPPPVKPPQVETRKIATAQFTNFKIVEDEKVTEPPLTVDALADVQIGTAHVEGDKFEGFVAPPVEATTGIVAAPKPIEDDLGKVFIRVEKEAKFPGGAEAWKKYLERYLNASVAADEGASIGFYTVKVQFIVDREGVISNVEAIEVPKACPGCGAEAVKVIKKGPNWEPAVQNDRKVAYQAIQYVTFQVAEE
jgi:protein TonB